MGERTKSRHIPVLGWETGSKDRSVDGLSEIAEPRNVRLGYLFGGVRGQRLGRNAHSGHGGKRGVWDSTSGTGWLNGAGMPRFAAGFHGVLSRIKKKYQPLSDIAGTYGSGVLGRISHECRFGLWLNLDRTEQRRARPIIIAIQAAISGDVPKSLFESLSETDEEGKAMHNLHEARMRIQSQRGNGEY